MANIIVLNSEVHRDLKIAARPQAPFDTRNFAAVIINEFPLLAAQYPILLAKDSDTGSFYCGVMLGFEQGENLFLDDAGWDGYRPLNLQRGPFYTNGEDLALDLDDPRVGNQAGEVLFEADGAMSPYLKSIIAAMQDLHPGLERSKRFIETLLQLKLVEPVDINVGFDDGSIHDLTGLYTIDREALKTLPDASVLDLFRRGYLQLIHLMIGSLQQISRLGERKNRRLAGAALSAPLL